MARTLARHNTKVIVIAVLVVLEVVSVCGLSATCGNHDIMPVTKTLVYTGPQQDTKKERGRESFRCFRGQHWEDLYMFQHLLHGVGNGFFIELGALDGYSYSVTYFFEIFLKWRGLLIEASPQNHQLFTARSRKMRAWRRRTVPYVHAAVCGEPMELTYVSKEGTGAGILEFMAADQRERNLRMCTNSTPGSTTSSLGKNDCLLTPIKCVHLGNMFKTRGVTHVDLFVLDVEGAELEVLNTVDLEETPVRYFLIELDQTAPEKDAKVRCVLRRAGFEPLGRLDLNEVWVNRRFPHERFASEYNAVKPQAWGRCFKSTSAVDFLHPEAWFSKLRGYDGEGGSGGAVKYTEGAERVADFGDNEHDDAAPVPPPTARPRSVIPAVVVSDVGSSADDASWGATEAPIVISVLTLGGFLAYRYARRWHLL